MGLGRDAASMLEMARLSRSGNKWFIMMATKTLGRDSSGVRCKTTQELGWGTDLGGRGRCGYLLLPFGMSRGRNARMPFVDSFARSACLTRGSSFAHYKASSTWEKPDPVAQSHQAIGDIPSDYLKESEWTFLK